jgi:hypothetical protein
MKNPKPKRPKLDRNQMILKNQCLILKAALIDKGFKAEVEWTIGSKKQYLLIKYTEYDGIDYEYKFFYNDDNGTALAKAQDYVYNILERLPSTADYAPWFEHAEAATQGEPT